MRFKRHIWVTLVSYLLPSLSVVCTYSISPLSYPFQARITEAENGVWTCSVFLSGTSRSPAIRASTNVTVLGTYNNTKKKQNKTKKNAIYRLGWCRPTALHHPSGAS